MSIPQRSSLVTLSVAGDPATAFYRAVGWQQSSASVAGEVTFFATPGGVLALWSTAELATDAGAPGGTLPGFRGVALAIDHAHDRGLPILPGPHGE